MPSITAPVIVGWDISYGALVAFGGLHPMKRDAGRRISYEGKEIERKPRERRVFRVMALFANEWQRK